MPDDEEEGLSKNHFSVVSNIEFADDPKRRTAKNFLTGGDAEVLIWEKLWDKYKKEQEVLAYDSMLTPHHCSWHSLSRDGRPDLADKAEVSAAAKSALSQIKAPAIIFNNDRNRPLEVGAF